MGALGRPTMRVTPASNAPVTGRRNDEIGTANYPSLDCAFSLRLITATAASMDVNARLTKGDCTAPEMQFTFLGPAPSNTRRRGTGHVGRNNRE